MGGIYSWNLKDSGSFLGVASAIVAEELFQNHFCEEISTAANEAPILDIKKTIGFIAEKLKMDKNWLMSIKAIDFIVSFKLLLHWPRGQ